MAPQEDLHYASLGISYGGIVAAIPTAKIKKNKKAAGLFTTKTMISL
jgi:hypothetical protein